MPRYVLLDERTVRLLLWAAGGAVLAIGLLVYGILYVWPRGAVLAIEGDA